MSRAKSAPRVRGPYTERGGTRFRIRICDETGRHDEYFASLQEAQDAKRQKERELPSQASVRRVADALAAYYREQVERGKCLEQTARDQKAGLGSFLSEYLNQDLGKLTAKRAAALYEHAIQ